MSAHPKIDPVTGEMIAYGYQAKGDLSDDIAVYTVNPQGHIVNEVWLKSPYLGIIHDIAITQKYILIPVIPRTTSLERLKTGEPMWEWDGDLPTMIGVLPRDGDAKDVRWFKGPSRNTLHFLNASDGGNKITMELPVSGRGALAVADQALDVRHELEERRVRRGSDLALERRARAHGRSLSVAAVPVRLCRQQRSERPYDTAAGGNRAGRVTNCYQRFDLDESRRAGSTFFVGRRAEPAGIRVRAAQGQHRGGRRLPHGHREQLRRDDVGAAHRRRAAHGRGCGRRREAAVPACAAART